MNEGPTPSRGTSVMRPDFQSPTSTAALALSSLFHSGVARRPSSSPDEPMTTTTRSVVSLSQTSSTSTQCSTATTSSTEETTLIGGGSSHRLPSPPPVDESSQHRWAALPSSDAAASIQSSSQPSRHPHFSPPLPPNSYRPYGVNMSNQKNTIPHATLVATSANLATDSQYHLSYAGGATFHRPTTPATQTPHLHRQVTNGSDSAGWSSSSAPPPNDAAYHDDGSHRMRIFVEATRAFAAFPSPPPLPPLYRNFPSSSQPQPPSSHSKNRHHPNNNKNRMASDVAGLVTPTPRKKQKLAANAADSAVSSSSNQYSRKTKSLGILCKNFIQMFQDDSNKIQEGRPLVCIDQAAKSLGVERRRIYDIINILESISVVTRKCKNTYHYNGVSELNQVFGKLQAEGFVEYRQDAMDNGLLATDDEDEEQRQLRCSNIKEKSLGRLSRQFLQLFLVGHEILSLTQASDKILGSSSTEELAAMALKKNSPSSCANAKSIQAAAARGLKTKIRRLYDIANVFLSLGVVSKVNVGRKAKPTFRWTYRLTPSELQALYEHGQQQEQSLSPTTTPATDNTRMLLANIHKSGGALEDDEVTATATPTTELSTVTTAKPVGTTTTTPRVLVNKSTNQRGGAQKERPKKQLPLNGMSAAAVSTPFGRSNSIPSVTPRTVASCSSLK